MASKRCSGVRKSIGSFSWVGGGVALGMEACYCSAQRLLFNSHYVNQEYKGWSVASAPAKVKLIMKADLLTVPEVAQRRGVSRSAVYKAIAQGRLHAQQVLGKWAVPASEADAWRATKSGGRRKGTTMSEEARARISAGQKQRWARLKSSE